MDFELMNSMLQKWVLDGGPVMFLLVPCSLVAVGGFLQLLIQLRRGRVVPREIARRAAEANADAAARAQFMRSLRGDGRPLALVVRRALQGAADLNEKPETRALEAQLEGAAIEVADEMSEGLGLLSTLYTVAPLIGLLGTVLGLMTTFGVFATGTEHSIQDMSSGVKQHLVATVWGLVIAIAAYIGAYFLQRRIIRYEREVLPGMGLEVIENLFPGSGYRVSGIGDRKEANAESRKVDAENRKGEFKGAMGVGAAGTTAVEGREMMSTTLLMDKEKLKAALAERRGEGEETVAGMVIGTVKK